MDIQFVTSVKDEGPYLLEWVAYHRSVGVTGFTFFHNNCSDGTVRILRRLNELGLARVIPNPTPTEKNPQGRALRRMMGLDHVRNADWVGFIDVDEFVNIHVGDRTIPGLIRHCGPDVEAISLNWVFFGSDAQKRFRDEPVTTRFRQANEYDFVPSSRLRETKTLFRPSRFARCSQHRPFTEPAGTPREWILGSGERAPSAFQSKGPNVPYRCVGFQLGQINHYAVKSREEFLLKRLRGSGFRTVLDRDADGTRFNWWYWDLYNRNQRKDTTLARKDMLQTLKYFKSDEQLKTLHKTSVQTHKKRAKLLYDQALLSKFLETGAVPIPGWRLKHRHAALHLKQMFPALNRLADLTG